MVSENTTQFLFFFFSLVLPICAFLAQCGAFSNPNANAILFILFCIQVFPTLVWLCCTNGEARRNVLRPKLHWCIFAQRLFFFPFSLVVLVYRIIENVTSDSLAASKYCCILVIAIFVGVLFLIKDFRNQSFLEPPQDFVSYKSTCLFVLLVVMLFFAIPDSIISVVSNYKSFEAMVHQIDNPNWHRFVILSLILSTSYYFMAVVDIIHLFTPARDRPHHNPEAEERMLPDEHAARYNYSLLIEVVAIILIIILEICVPLSQAAAVVSACSRLVVFTACIFISIWIIYSWYHNDRAEQPHGHAEQPQAAVLVLLSLCSVAAVFVLWTEQRSHMDWQVKLEIAAWFTDCCMLGILQSILLIFIPTKSYITVSGYLLILNAWSIISAVNLELHHKEELLHNNTNRTDLLFRSVLALMWSCIERSLVALEMLLHDH